MAPCLLIVTVGSRISRDLSNASKPNFYITPTSLRSDEENTQLLNSDSLSITISSHFTTSANYEQTHTSPSGGNVTDETLVDDNRNKVESELHEDDGDNITEFQRAGRVAQVVRQIEQPVDSQQAKEG